MPKKAGAKMLKEAYEGCLIVAAIIVVAAVIMLLMLRGCAGRNTSNKDQIIQFTLDNEALLNQAIAQIEDLDAYIGRIAHTRFSRLRPTEGFDFEGLYTSGVIGSEVVRTPLENPILYKLLQDGTIRSISISSRSPIRRMDHIQFAFNVRGGWDRYGGIYFSRHNIPLSFGGQVWKNPEAYRNGWVSYGHNFYYTERIVAYWFYYEMLFSSTRRPNRGQ